MRRICVLTTDNFLFQKIKLALLGRAEVSLGEGASDLRIIDLDSGYNAKAGDVTASRYGDCNLRIPFPLSALDELLSDNGTPLLSSFPDGRCAILRGEPIKLTEVEYSLFEALMKRNGEFVSREVILDEVWGDGADAGVINVYIHYLREKLEKEGEKIIVSSRKMGYKIDEKYLGGKAKC